MMETVSRLSVAGDELVPVMKEILAGGGTFPLTVTGTSMTPTLKDGRDQVVLVSPFERAVKIREIVFFQRESGEYILHRVRKDLGGGKLLINGDAQNWTEIIDRDQVIGVVASITRNGREIACDDRFYRCYVMIWSLMKPVRPFVFRLHRIYKRVRNLMRKG